MKKFARITFHQKVIWVEVISVNGEEYLYEIDGDIYGRYNLGKCVGPADQYAFSPPCSPSKIVGLAYNYLDLTEGKKISPLIFFKSKESIITSNNPIKIDREISKIWAEVELGIVVKNDLFKASSDEAKDSILGYLVANDVTCENIDARDHHLAYSKSRLTFCPVSNFIVTDIDTSNLRLETKINGLITQSSSTNMQYLNPIQSLVYISQHIPISKGDLIITGTPYGYHKSGLKPGDIINQSIESVGDLKNTVETY